jgi:SulP family sulfate permease
MKRTESQLVLRRAFSNLFSEPIGFRPWGDLQGALVGALVSVPQVLAFGLIIGSALGGPLTGEGLLIALYGAVLLGMAGALFGGCPYLITGPRASAILVFAALIRELAQSEALSHYHDPSEMALALACSAALLSGLLQIAFSLFRFGRLVNYVPLPVMQGFINGSALLIILSQVWAALGIPEQRSYWSVFSHLDEMRPATLLLALGTTASVKFFSRITKKIPPMPLAFIAGTVAYHFAASFGYGADLGGTLPPPPAHFALHFVAGETASVLFAHTGVAFSVLTAAISMALLSTLDTLLATAATDEITCRRSNADRQLMAEGLGNALAGMFGMAPGSSGLARIKAAIDAGMKSARAPLGVALITLVVVLAFGPMIGRMSQAVMAGILISLGLDLLDKSTLSGLRKIGSRGMAVRPDILVVATVVATALFCDLKTAVGVGVLLSVISFVTQMSHSPIRRCYRATALIPRIFGDAARHRFIA